MVDTWVSLLVAGTLLLVGFAASLAFHRFRVPDFIFLLLLGAGLGLVPVPPFGPGLLASLGPLLPVFTQLSIAFILFEGGLSLRLHESGRSLPAIVGHALGAMALTALLTWLVITRLFGVDQATGLVLAMAFAGPSASIALSFAPRMRLGPPAETTIVLEGVLTNVVAVIGVLLILQWYGAPGGFAFAPYLLQMGEALGLAMAAGLAWSRVVERLAEQPFVYIASLGLAIALYGTAQGLFAQTGALTVFVFGAILGHERSVRSRPAEERAEAPTSPPSERVLQELEEFVAATDGWRTESAQGGGVAARNLKHFQAEITFALRTFFFVYLGLLLTAEWGGIGTVFAAVLIVGAFFVGRVPTSLALGRGLRMSKRDSRALLGSMARGMTDVVILLFAAQSGVLSTSEVQFVLSIMPATVLLAAIVCAGLLIWAGHSPGPEAALEKSGSGAPAKTNAR